MGNDSCKHPLIDQLSTVMNRLYEFRPVLDDRQDIELLDLIRLAKASTVTDPRDKVFSILALLPREIAARIYPDDSPAFSGLNAFVMFSKSCYQAAGNLDILARLQRPASLTKGLPT